MELTFQVPMQYCSLQHQTLFPSPVTSTTGWWWCCCFFFCFGSVPSFFLELFFHWSPVAYWVPTDLGSSSFSVLSFCLFICHAVLKVRTLKWFAIPSLVDHVLSEFCTMTHPSILGGPTCHGSSHSFIELDKAMVHVIRDVRVLYILSQHQQIVTILLLPFQFGWLSFLYLTWLLYLELLLLNRNSKSGDCCLVSNFKGKVFNFSPLNMMLAVGLSLMIFFMLRYVPSILMLLKVFFFKSWMDEELFQMVFLHLLRLSFDFYHLFC